MQSLFPDTIFALSSGPLPSGVAIVRVSGKKAHEIGRAIAGDLPEMRRLFRRPLRAMDGELIDIGLVTAFPAGRSFTGEAVVEFHVHGGKAVVRRLLEEVGRIPDTRAASAGEFTRRAFMHGKLDLTEVEALGDLINAETEAQRRIALDYSRGTQSSLYLEWRHQLVELRALVEAGLDFSDEEGVEADVSEKAMGKLRLLKDEIAVHIQGYRRGEIIRDGYRIVIAGPPNVGKSSLLNVLAKRDVAIVSEEAGTTRDVLSITMDLDGHATVVMDTAGIRESAEKVELLGIQRSYDRLSEADLVLELVEAGQERQEIPESRYPGEKITVLSKIDLDRSDNRYDMRISVKSGEGIVELLEELARRVREAAGGHDIVPTRERHVAALRDAIGHIDRALEIDDLVTQAEELRLASRSLDCLIGRIDVEDVLDMIFSNFCIGK